jgi:hypothetical protein
MIAIDELTDEQFERHTLELLTLPSATNFTRI